MKTLLKRLVGWCLALLGWSVSLVFRLVDWVLYPKQVAEYTPEWTTLPGPMPVKEPAKVVTPDRPVIDHYLAIIQRDEWQEQVYKEIDELVPYVLEGGPP